MDNELIDYLTSISNCNDEDEIWDNFQNTMGDMGFNTVGYAILPTLEIENLIPIIVGNYKKNWLERYANKNYQLTDGLVLHATQSVLPLVLDSDKTIDAENFGCAQMVDEVREVGMKRTLFIPVANSQGQVGGCVTLGTELLNSKDFEHTVKDKLSTIYAISVNAYHKLHGSLEKNIIINNSELTPRQYDILMLLDQGKNNDQIADKLDITQATVSHHLIKLRKTFDCATNRQILPRAYDSGILNIYD